MDPLHDLGLDKIRTIGLIDDSQLIAEILVECLEPLRQVHYRLAALVGGHDAIVDVLHVRGFDKGVVEKPVPGIKRVVDFEGTATLAQGSRDMNNTLSLLDIGPLCNTVLSSEAANIQTLYPQIQSLQLAITQVMIITWVIRAQPVVFYTFSVSISLSLITYVMTLSRTLLPKKQNKRLIAVCYKISDFGIRFAIGFSLNENKTASRFAALRTSHNHINNTRRKSWAKRGFTSICISRF